MKLAVLADIHANYPALLTVTEHIEAWQPDVVVVAGDVINRGARPAECWRFVQEKRRTQGWLLTIGNHEEYVISQNKPDAPRNGPQAEIQRASYWTYQKIGCDVSALEAMPFKLCLDPADQGHHEHGNIRITHASMLSLRDGIYIGTTDDELRERVGLPRPALFCVGHTHRPLVRQVDDTLVVNVGAAGMPFDGDWRVSYAQLTWLCGEWRAEIVRLEYDYAQAERDFYESGFIDEGGALAKLMLRELQISRGQLYSWMKLYEQPVLAGEITVEQAVERFLQSESAS
jgi:predicted phosphodiesterase